MGKEIKFEFIYSNGKTFIKTVADLDEICAGNAANDSMYEKATDDIKDNSDIEAFSLVARREFINLQDKLGIDIYIGDIVKDRAGRWFEIGYCFDYKEKGDRLHFLRYEMKCVKQSDKINYKFTRIGELVELSHWMYPTPELEIIGNTTETPTLLNNIDSFKSEEQ